MINNNRTTLDWTGHMFQYLVRHQTSLMFRYPEPDLDRVLVVAVELVVGSAEAVLPCIRVVKVAAVDVDGAVEAGVAAGSSVSHRTRTALRAVEAVAGSDAVQCSLWLCRASSKPAALPSARSAAASHHSAASSAVVAAVVVVWGLRVVVATGWRVSFAVGGDVLKDPLPLVADLLVDDRVLVVDSPARVLLEHAVEQLLDRVCSAPVIKFL
jgi:hypothetical protein